MLPRCDGFDGGEWPGSALGLSLPVHQTLSVGCLAASLIRFEKEGKILRKREAGREPHSEVEPGNRLETGKGVCLGNPSGHDSSVGLEKGSVHQRKIFIHGITCLLIHAVYYSTGKVVTESSILKVTPPSGSAITCYLASQPSSVTGDDIWMSTGRSTLAVKDMTTKTWGAKWVNFNFNFIS